MSEEPVHVELFDHLLLLAAIASAATIVRIVRRSEGIGRGYAIVVGVVLILAVLAMGAGRAFGVVALALALATVALPWLLEHASRWAFARGHFAWVGRMSTLRASLMLGSGIGRQLPILEGLSLLERDGVDAALVHYRRLADEAEDGTELAMIHEQIVAMLFHGQRWDEGIAHYERRFHAGYAALRPTLALGLLRAYGESGRLETAAGLLRELEDGPVGADPKTAELLGQARLTFLAYAGAVDPVAEVARRERFVSLGLTAATAALFEGIAQTRAGAPRDAVETLTRVEDLAGPRDHRVREAARTVLERTRVLVEGSSEGPAADSGGIQLPPELDGYVELVAARLRSFISANPLVRRHERPLATYGIIAGLSLVYAIYLLRGGGGVGLLELGALSQELWWAGSWGRAFTSAWIHTDLVGLLFDAYAIWLAGQIVERLLGSVRMILVTVVAAIAGTVVSALDTPALWGLDFIAVVAPTAGNLMAVGAITAALWMLMPRWTPALSARPRRNLVVTLGLLLLANLLTHWPVLTGAAVAPLALLTTITFASVVALALPLEPSRWLRVTLAASVVAVLGVNVAGFVVVLGEDPEAYLVDNRTQRCELGGVVVRTPQTMTVTSLDREARFPTPILDGVMDSLELRGGGVVQLAVSAAPIEDGRPALFDLVEGLDVELSSTAVGAVPEPFAERIADDGDGRWRAMDLWKNGERVARVVERRLGEGEGGASLMVVATPPEALEHGASIYAAIMSDAELGGAGDRVRCD